MAVVVGVVVASEGKQLAFQRFALRRKEDKESPALLWIFCGGHQVETRLALAVLIAQGVNGARDGTVRKVQRIFDCSECAWLVFADDQEDLCEVCIEVSGFQDRKQAQSPL
jgi:hypothetical protein